MIELLTYYVIGGALIIGPPAIFLIIAMMGAIQNTKGRMVGYKDHKEYGDSSIYENSPSDQTRMPSLTKVDRIASCSSLSSAASFILLSSPFFLGSSFLTSSGIYCEATNLFRKKGVTGPPDILVSLNLYLVCHHRHHH